MKKILTLTVMILSFSASADVVLFQKLGPRECTVTKNKVEIKYTMNNGKTGFTTTQAFSGFGYEEMAKKAAALSTQTTNPYDMEVAVVVDGSKYLLTESDSKEALSLMGFIGNICK